MPSLNFKKEFATMVESGKKRQTIRKLGKRNYRPGQTAYLYTGQRTKECRQLWHGFYKGTPPAIKSVEPIVIWERDSGIREIQINTRRLYFEEKVDLARADGFNLLIYFYQFFEREHGFPFHGLLIKW